MIKNKIIKYFIHRYFSLLLPVIFFFLVQMSVDVPFLYARGLEAADQYGDVNIYFQFDQRLKARPFRVFLKKKSEWYKKTEDIEPTRLQYYEVGKLIYDFQKIEPGKYWVGFSFKYLKKDDLFGSPFEEFDYVRPGASTGDYKPTENRIEVKKNIRVCVDLIIKIFTCKRPGIDGDPEGLFKFIPRSKPKSSEEELMLDENYFPIGGAGFSDVKRSSSKNVDIIEITFLHDVFDDYPLVHWQ